MKTYRLILNLLLLLAVSVGCKKDDPNPCCIGEACTCMRIRIDLSFNPDLYRVLTSCANSETGMPKFGKITGTVLPLIAESDTLKGEYYLESCSFNPISQQITGSTTGYVSTISGDKISYKWTLILNLSDSTLIGDIRILGGCGKYYRSEGSAYTTGETNFTTGTSRMTGEGWIAITE